jgi:hypothetical protein
VSNYRRLLACSDAELAQVDPLLMNLLVAKSIPSLADLDIAPYLISPPIRSWPTSGPTTCVGGCRRPSGCFGRRRRIGRMT